MSQSWTYQTWVLSCWKRLMVIWNTVLLLSIGENWNYNSAKSQTFTTTSSIRRPIHKVIKRHLDHVKARSCSLLVNPVREAPAAMRVGVSVSCVDEAVLQRTADVMSWQTCDRCHHVPGELSNLQGPFVLTSPPVVLRPERQKYWGWNRRNHSCWHHHSLQGH